MIFEWFMLLLISTWVLLINIVFLKNTTNHMVGQQPKICCQYLPYTSQLLFEDHTTYYINFSLVGLFHFFLVGKRIH